MISQILMCLFLLTIVLAVAKDVLFVKKCNKVKHEIVGNSGRNRVSVRKVAKFQQPT